MGSYKAILWLSFIAGFCNGLLLWTREYQAREAQRYYEAWVANQPV